MKTKNIKGITLLELMITVSLMGILLLLASVSFNNSIKTQNAKNAIKQAAYAINTARYYSKKNGLASRLDFPIGSHEYIIESNDKYLTSSSNFGAVSGVLPDKTIITGNTCNDIYFYVDGTPLTEISPDKVPLSNHCSITIGYETGPKKTLYLHAETGSISYE